jgi:RNA polymerase subunit RPABC4/transcription elongation factor Spt4
MPLIKCPECGKEISDQAQSCPHCGNPIKPVVIEQTGKKWKLAKVITWLIFWFGAVLILVGAGNGGFDNPLTGLGITLAFLGFIARLVVRFGSWWSHK